MPIWAIIVLSVYVIGFVTMLVAVLNEAGKQQVDVTAIHIIVPLIWPFWGVWYLIDSFIESRKRR